ncbi:MAG: DUF429 domain-containing protein [Planctomycetaceae bacterium]
MTAASRSRGPVVLGVDFTSAPRPRKPLTVAVGRLVGRSRDPVYRIDEIRELPSLAAFDGLLREPGEWLGGFDLPFGQPRALIEHEGWPTDWRAFVAFYCDQPREHLRDVFRRWCAGRPAGDKFAWRKADRPAGSSPAMRWTNPPVAWMMHAGIGRMLAAGLAFPAHKVAGRRGGRIALEAYPGFTARRACRRSYKSDTPAMQTAERRTNRRTILRALESGTAGVTVRLEATDALARRMLADGAGDLLDAAICGLQAAHASLLPRYGLPDDLDPLEGWIASVPQEA